MLKQSVAEFRHLSLSRVHDADVVASERHPEKVRYQFPP